MRNLIAIILLATALAADAQQYRLSGPDYFGNRTITGPRGFSGSISSPDYFGGQTFRYNNGVSGTISAPDYFGNRSIYYNQPITMPRYNTYGRW